MKELFFRPLVINKKDTDVLFWSDTHFGHRCEHWGTPLWKSRGFSSVEEHDETLIKRWNEKSSYESTFFVLGDFMFGMSSFERFEQTLHRLQFSVLYMMPGNHQTGWKQHFTNTRGNVWNLNENKTVVFTPNYLEATVNDNMIVMCHYPIASFNQQRKGSWHLHGHCHGNLQTSGIGKILYSARVADVGVEVEPKPVTFKEIAKKFEHRPIKTFDDSRDLVESSNF
jgi:calcineurin-like phosphoesterase family protein